MERLTIFLSNGQTLRFEQVTGLPSTVRKDDFFTFEYVSKTDGVKSSAVFLFDDAIAGISRGNI